MSKVRQWRGRPTWLLLLLLATRLLRGACVRLRLGRAGCSLLCERHVRLYHPRHIRVGDAFNLEEGCEIVGLSKQGVNFGDRCTVGRHATVRPTNVLLAEPGEGLWMGDHSNIGAYSYIGCSGLVRIGSNVLMGPRVSILAENHKFDRTDRLIKEQGVERGPITIEDDCWIGAGATILANTTVHRGAVIAAGAVVTGDVEPGAVVGGVPARVLRMRNGKQ